MRYYILKGCHYSLPPISSIHFGDTINTYIFKFHSNCYYKDTKKHINKLCGLSFGYHHENSVRLGWNCGKQNNKIQLYAYIYNKGVRKEYYLDDYSIDKWYKIGVMFNRLENMVYIGSIGIKFDMTDLPMIGYNLKPYFGGKQVAPHTMTIDLK